MKHQYTAYYKFIIGCGVHLNLPVLPKYDYYIFLTLVYPTIYVGNFFWLVPENRNISNCTQDEPELEGNFPVKKQRGNLQND